MGNGYFVSYEGKFQSQEQASRLIAILSGLTLVVVFLLLYAHFHSGIIVAQVLINGPLAFVGALVLTDLLIGTVTVATLVGMITLLLPPARRSTRRLPRRSWMAWPLGRKPSTSRRTRWGTR